jgi:hypothetical protein
LAGGTGDKKMPYVEGSAGGNEVRTLLSGAEQAARTILADNEQSLRLIASTLAERETLSASELAELHRSGVTGGASGRSLTGGELFDGAAESRLPIPRPDVIDLPPNAATELRRRLGAIFEEPDY